MELYADVAKNTPHNTTVQYNATPAYQQQAAVNPGAITVGVYTAPQTYPTQGQMAALSLFLTVIRTYKNLILEIENLCHAMHISLEKFHCQRVIRLGI